MSDGSPKIGAPERLERFHAAARARWPAIEVDRATFDTYVTERLPADLDPADALADIRGDDLYLACACARGGAGAVQTLEREHDALLSSVHARAGAARITADEYRQRLREHLYTGDRPAIASYRGRGSLAAWLRVTATRALINWSQRDPERHEVAVTRDELLAVAGSASDPESPLIRAGVQQAFARAFEAALASLPARERSLLRERYVVGKRVDELAAAHGLHRVTVSRLLSSALEQVFEVTRRELKQALAVDDQDAAELIELVRSRLDLSLSRILGGAG